MDCETIEFFGRLLHFEANDENNKACKEDGLEHWSSISAHEGGWGWSQIDSARKLHAQ